LNSAKRNNKIIKDREKRREEEGSVTGGPLGFELSKTEIDCMWGGIDFVSWGS
jgi:hypothetical protein